MSEKEAKRLGNDDQSCAIFFREKNSIKTNYNSKKNFPRITMEVWHNLLTNRVKNILSARSQT